MDEKKQEAYRIGVSILILLAILTIGEYFVGVVAYNWWFVLIGIAIIKAYYVVRDYMHIGRVFAGDEETQS